MAPETLFRKKPCDICRRLMSNNHFVSPSVSDLIKILPKGTKIEHPRCPSGYILSSTTMEDNLFLCGSCRKLAVHKAFSAATASTDTQDPLTSPVPSKDPCSVCYRRMQSNAFISGFEEHALRQIPGRIFLRTVVKRACFWPWPLYTNNQLTLCKWCKVCAMEKAAHFLVEKSRVQSSRKKRKPRGIIEEEVLMGGNAECDDVVQAANLTMSKPSKRQKRRGSRRLSRYGANVGLSRNNTPLQSAINKPVQKPKRIRAMKFFSHKSPASIDVIDLTTQVIDTGSASLDNANAKSANQMLSDPPFLHRSETINHALRKPPASVEKDDFTGKRAKSDATSTHKANALDANLRHCDRPSQRQKLRKHILPRKHEQDSFQQYIRKTEIDRLRLERQRLRLERERIVLEYKYRTKDLDERVQRIKADLQKWYTVEKIVDKAFKK